MNSTQEIIVYHSPYEKAFYDSVSANPAFFLGVFIYLVLFIFSFWIIQRKTKMKQEKSLILASVLAGLFFVVVKFFHDKFII